MNLWRWIIAVKNTLGRGIFPHQLSSLLELPWRNAVLSPRTLAARLPLDAASRVLEVGAGAGFYSLEVARRLPAAGRLDILDIQPQMLTKAQRKLEAHGQFNARYTLADASGKLPFDDASFDLIFLVTVFGEITNQPAFLREARRVLKPHGTLSISEHYPDPDFKPFTKLKSLVEPQGFQLSAHHGTRRNYTANFKKSDATY